MFKFTPTAQTSADALTPTPTPEQVATYLGEQAEKNNTKATFKDDTITKKHMETYVELSSTPIGHNSIPGAAPTAAIENAVQEAKDTTLAFFAAAGAQLSKAIGHSKGLKAIQVALHPSALAMVQASLMVYDMKAKANLLGVDDKFFNLAKTVADLQTSLKGDAYAVDLGDENTIKDGDKILNGARTNEVSDSGIYSIARHAAMSALLVADTSHTIGQGKTKHDFKFGDDNELCVLLHRIMPATKEKLENGTEISIPYSGEGANEFVKVGTEKRLKELFNERYASPQVEGSETSIAFKDAIALLKGKPEAVRAISEHYTSAEVCLKSVTTLAKVALLRKDGRVLDMFNSDEEMNAFVNLMLDVKDLWIDEQDKLAATPAEAAALSA